ncbi:MAG: DUF2141 domain-containing protein, partial [Caldithrix sp.]|nr:DUF2141 domain-containing protein [Caldithrix sp.]
TVTAQNDSVTIRFKDIAYGSYAVSLIHDENENMELDSNWLGIPKEGIAFSNNVKGRFGPPSFNEAKFELNSKSVIQTVTMHYY